MNTIIHKSDSRGRAEHGWLRSRHTFSFADYHDPARVHFGALRVINDDVVAPGAGFGTHPHRDMEIISVPLDGALRHRDNLGNVHVIRAGEIQVMSAGTGIAHSEFNDSQTAPVNFLQIWVMPKFRGIAPRYGQQPFEPAGRRNRFQLAVSPDGADGSLAINQDAWLALADLDAGGQVNYSLHTPQYGLYVFVIDGRVTIDGDRLDARDGMGIRDTAEVSITAVDDARVLVIEVPMD
jgi:redox-sensitive bicupin YhaK (pirin superfamily)